MSATHLLCKLVLECRYVRSERCHPVRFERFCHEFGFKIAQVRRGQVYLRLLSQFCSRGRTVAGTPIATLRAGMSWMTTAPAATMVASPIVTPGRIVAPAPIQLAGPTATPPASTAPGETWTPS